jgi:hypothetical protein
MLARQFLAARLRDKGELRKEKRGREIPLPSQSFAYVPDFPVYGTLVSSQTTESIRWGCEECVNLRAG